jgi:hypothetical protein
MLKRRNLCKSMLRNYSNDSWNCPTANLPLRAQQELTESYYKANGFHSTVEYLNRHKTLVNSFQLANFYLRHAQIKLFFETFKSMRQTWFPICINYHLLFIQTCFTSLINQSRSSDCYIYNDETSIQFTHVISELQRHLAIITQNHTRHRDSIYPNLSEIAVIVYSQINLVPKALVNYDHYQSHCKPSQDCLDFFLQKLSLVPYKFHVKVKSESNLPMNVDELIEVVFKAFGDRRPTLRSYISIIRYFSAYGRDREKAIQYFRKGCKVHGDDKLCKFKELFIDGIKTDRGMSADAKVRDRWEMWDGFVKKRPGWSLLRDDAAGDTHWDHVAYKSWRKTTRSPDW